MQKYFVILCQYQYGVQPDRLNYGKLKHFFWKRALYIDQKLRGPTTDVERKWRQIYVKPFEKMLVPYLHYV